MDLNFNLVGFKMYQQEKDAAARRKVLSNLTVAAISQTKWVAPVVATAILPAHAATSELPTDEKANSEDIDDADTQTIATSSTQNPSVSPCTICECIIPGITFGFGEFPSFSFDGNSCKQNLGFPTADTFLLLDIRGSGLEVLNSPVPATWSSTHSNATVGSVGQSETRDFMFNISSRSGTYAVCFSATFDFENGATVGSTSDICISAV